MSQAKTRLRKMLVAHLEQLGIEKKRAHSDVGYLLNRRDHAAVTAAVLAANTENPIMSIRQSLGVDS